MNKGNIKHLLRALGALFILNLYFKDEVHNFENDSKATSFPINMGSDIFAIKLHKWFSYGSSYNYGKNEDFDECVYLTKYTDDSLEKKRQATEEMMSKQSELFLRHPKFLEYIKTNDIKDYNGQNLMWDVLGEDDYLNIIRIASQKPMEVFKSTEYEAIINKNSI